MSRAFVKDDSDRPEPPIVRVPGDEPNYVTAQGLEKLEAALATAVAEGDARNVDYFERRIASAILDVPSKRKRGVVAFGSTVVTKDAGGRETRVTIVGEDEADPASGSIGWTSPYAQALLGRKARKGNDPPARRSRSRHDSIDDVAVVARTTNLTSKARGGSLRSCDGRVRGR